MKRAIFLDIDGTLTGTISGQTFKQHPHDISVLPGVEKALQYYQSQSPKWVFIGVSNQGGCSSVNPKTGKTYKTVEDAIAEMRFTINLLPQLQAIYFCPDFEGVDCWKVTRDDAIVESLGRHSEPEQKYLFRKPAAGMLYRAAREYQIDLKQSWMVGDRTEDEMCANNAGVSFMPADIWRMRFTPGVYEFRKTTREQLGFLENINVSEIFQ